MKTRLDAKAITAMTLPRERAEEIYWGTELEGFGLRLRRRRDGSLLRTYAVQYRVDGHTRRKTVGSADKISLAQARDAARKDLARVELGHDPQAERAAKRREATHTVRATVATYLEARQPELRPASFRVTELYLTGGYFRAVHSKAITAVTRADVAACTRTILRNHSRSTASAARRALSAFFAWTIADGLLGNGANPVDGSHRPDDPTPRDHVPTAEELVTIWSGCGDDDFGRIVRLLILLGSRRSEVAGMRWSEIDPEAGTWTLPAERSKNHRPHIVTLPPAALAIVRTVPRTSRDHLFGSRASVGFTSFNKAKRELDRRLGSTVRPWRIHDLRRAVATGLIDIGVEPHHVEACLNHYSGHRAGVAGTYNRSSYTRPIAASLARWSEHLAAMIEGRDSKIVPLQRA
jgi:integrase